MDTVTAEVALSRDDAVVVRAPKGNAAFVSEVDRLQVRPIGRAHFEILIPRSAPRVTIEAGGDTVFRAADSRVITDARRDADGRYTLRLAPVGP